MGPACYVDFCLTMGKRGRPLEGVYGRFIDPTKPGALYQSCRRFLSRATTYRWIALGWPRTLPTEIGSCQPSGGSLEGPTSCHSAHPDWIHYDRLERPPLTDQTSVEASARSFAAAQHKQGYATRSQRGGVQMDDVNCPAPVDPNTPRTQPMPAPSPPRGGFPLTVGVDKSRK